MFYRKKSQIVRLIIFCTMLLGIILFSATVISENQDDNDDTEETLEFHIQRPPHPDLYLWSHSDETEDIAADVEHTHPAQTHTHKNWWGDYDEENDEPTETFPKHTHAAYTHGPHNKAHYRPGPTGHTPHNSDDGHNHDYILVHDRRAKGISHVHPSDTSHMGGRTHTHPGWWHQHGDGETVHEDHDADGEHTHPPITVPGPIRSVGHALPYHSYIGYNGYTHTHPDPAFEAHKTENPPHTDHTSYVAHTHNEVTHTHDDFSEHTHPEHSHSHTDDIAEFEKHKTERLSHTTHKSFVEHTHNGQTHSHNDYPSHTHNGYTHSHTDDIAELEAHKRENQTHTPHKSFVEHTHNGPTHSHDDYPNHTHNGYSHSHTDDIAELEKHKQERQTHTPHKSFVQHTHNGPTHSHDDYPNHTHNGYSHSHTDDIAELEKHKQERQTHTPHKSFVQHTHNGPTHSHDDYPNHTHNGYSHSHTDDIAELEKHKQERQTHTPHKSFVEHTHNPQTHSHDDYPSHTHNGITHTHQAERNELEAHRQQRLPHSEHTTTGEHEHTAQPHQHDEYPEHTYVSYSHTHPVQPQSEPEQPDETNTDEQNTQTEPQNNTDTNQQQSEATTPQNTNPNTDTQMSQTGQDDVQQPESEAETEPNYTIIPFDYKYEGVGKVVFSELMLAHLDKYPQWIELYNTTDQDIDMNGWKIVGRYLDDTHAINRLESQVISKSFTIKGKETGLIVSFVTPYSRDTISRGLAERTFALGSSLKNLWNYDGLVLELHDAEGNPIDRIGNLNEEDEIVWEIPSVVREKRISLIRRIKSIRSQEYSFSFGTKKFGWIPAEKIKLLIEGRNQYYYGRNTDIGTPGYRTEDGEALPVTLSSFKAQRNNDNQIVLSWVTESELDNAGFNILRSQSKQGPFIKVNPKLIQGAGTTGERSTYTWTDTTAKPNTVYYYQIEDVSYAGVHQTLTTTRLNGLISSIGKIITQWADFKKGR